MKVYDTYNKLFIERMNNIHYMDYKGQTQDILLHKIRVFINFIQYCLIRLLPLQPTTATRSSEEHSFLKIKYLLFLPAEKTGWTVQ